MLTNAAADYLPVVVAGFVSVPVGMLWFSPTMFGKPWMRMTGIRSDAMKAGAGGSAFGVSLMSALVMSFVLWVLMGVMGLTTLPTAWSIAVLLWLSFDFLPSFTHSLFARKPFPLLLINTGYELVNALLMATIFTYWR